jgi:hypothetical protein
MPTAPTSFKAVFPAMYYDSPVEQLVHGFTVSSDDSLTASITTNSLFFKVSKIDVCNWIVVFHPPPLPDPGEGPSPGQGGGPTPPIHLPPAPPPTRTLSDPVATSDGVTPLAVKGGQFARLWVTANVPKGALPPGDFTGTVVIKGKNSTITVVLQGTYLGNLLGNVVLEPPAVAPAQSVFLQVCDASGHPISDASVKITVQGVQTTARYYQFAAAGNFDLIVNAARGPLRESTNVTIQVAGEPLKYRATLGPAPLTAMPIIQVTQDPGKPYVATFSLDTPSFVRRILAKAHPMGAPSGAPQAPVTPVSQAPVDALNDEFTKAIASLPPEQVTRIAPTSTVTSAGTATHSAVFAPVALKTPPMATSYKWDFGDGQVVTTQAPTVSHDYFPAIKPDKVEHSFDVTCTIVHDNLTVKRTLVLHSAYGLCRQATGIIVPPVTGDVYATFQHLAFSGSMLVHNLEAYPITLNSMACVPLSSDPSTELASPRFTNMQVPIVLEINSATLLGVYVSLDQLQQAAGALGPNVPGFTVYYSGEMLDFGKNPTPGDQGTWIPVRFSYTFQIKLSDSGLAWAVLPPEWSSSQWDVASALRAVSTIALDPKLPVSKAGGQFLDTATKTLAITLSSRTPDATTLAQARSAVQTGLSSIAINVGALSASGVVFRPHRPGSPVKRPDSPFDPLSPLPVAEGNECYPDDISDADAATANAQQLVCQLTGNIETITMPASFQNAQQGDVILSPAPVGGGDMIAAMFRALTPPQHHGHSGIMTRNFLEITHCTASPDRIKNNPNTITVTSPVGQVTIPTSLNSDMLQYGWPGSITQSIDDALGSSLIDPSGDSYWFPSFNPDTIGDGFELIPPLVVKPLPENEANFRALLRKVAETARSKGAQYAVKPRAPSGSPQAHVQGGGCYYSFYCYTKPEISAGFTDPAGADAGWAKGMSPAVCSSFVWLCMKENNVALVTPNQDEKLSDFSPSAVAGGAEVGPATLDGLIYYPQAERQQGAQALYTMLMNQALSQEFGLGTIPGINSTIAGPIADQLINCFAFGNPNMVGSSAWQNPGDGNAVSPDNIIWWNPPCFGYAEPLQYLPQHTEQYATSAWKKVITWGSIKGRVLSNGAPVSNAHVWVYLPGGDGFTGSDGSSYTLNHIPIGSYSLKAQATLTTLGVSVEATNGLDGQPITLSAANPNIVQDIELQGLPPVYRRLDISCSISCDHGDDNPYNTHGVQTAGPSSESLFVNPGKLTDSYTYSYNYAGGGYFHIDYVFTIGLLLGGSIQLVITGTMYDDNSGSEQDQYTIGPFTIPMSGWQSGGMNMEQSGGGYHNGPANFTFVATNNQQTG